MKGIFKSALLSGIVSTSIVGAALLPAKPANADVLRNAAVGAAANVVTGEVINNGNILGNAASGAATGAAVGATHNRSNGRAASLVQDTAVGAATNVVTGEIINNGKPWKNAIGGAATGVLINVTKD